jgi:DNA mismatch endonuclease (patch repair protein)
MTDIVSSDKRSRMMRGIRGKNTRPEILVRKAIFAEGLRFRLHRKDLPGNPDIVLSRKKVLIFVHGCFWHQHTECRFAKMPASNADFWQKKLNANSARDRKILEELNRLGWRVLIVWECATRDRSLLKVLGHMICEWIKGDESMGSIPDIRNSEGRIHLG